MADASAVRGDRGGRGLPCGIVLVAGLCWIGAATFGRLVMERQVSIRFDSLRTPVPASHSLHTHCTMVDAVRGDSSRRLPVPTCGIPLVASSCGLGAVAGWRLLVLRCQVSIRYGSTPVSTSHSLCADCTMVDAVRGGGGGHGLTCGVVMSTWLCVLGCRCWVMTGVTAPGQYPIRQHPGFCIALAVCIVYAGGCSAQCSC
jgi:hypothetical protein